MPRRKNADTGIAGAKRMNTLNDEHRLFQITNYSDGTTNASTIFEKM